MENFKVKQFTEQNLLYDVVLKGQKLSIKIKKRKNKFKNEFVSQVSKEIIRSNKI